MLLLPSPFHSSQQALAPQLYRPTSFYFTRSNHIYNQLGFCIAASSDHLAARSAAHYRLLPVPFMDVWMRLRSHQPTHGTPELLSSTLHPFPSTTFTAHLPTASCQPHRLSPLTHSGIDLARRAVPNLATIAGSKCRNRSFRVPAHPGASASSTLCAHTVRPSSVQVVHVARSPPREQRRAGRDLAHHASIQSTSGGSHVASCSSTYPTLQPFHISTLCPHFGDGSVHKLPTPPRSPHLPFLDILS